MNEAPAWGSQGRGSVRSRTDCRSHHEADVYEVSLTSSLRQEAGRGDPDLTRSSYTAYQLRNGVPPIRLPGDLNRAVRPSRLDTPGQRRLHSTQADPGRPRRTA